MSKKASYFSPEDVVLIEPLLPSMAVVFVRLIGMESAMRLFEEFGGVNWRFSKGVQKFGPGAQRFDEMAAVIGKENALLLGNALSEGDIYIPRCAAALNALRNRQITKDFDDLVKRMSGREACNQLARRYHRSAKSIENAVNGKVKPSRAKPVETPRPPKPDNPQGDPSHGK